MRILSWMSKLFFTAVFAAVVSVMTTWIMVDLYTEQIFKKFNMESMQVDLQPGDMWSHLSNGVNKMEETTAVDSPGDEDAESESESASADAEESESARSGTDEDAESDAQNEIQGDAVAVWSQSGSEQGEELEKRLVMSAEEFDEKKDKISDEDKMEIFSIVATKVPQEALMQLSLLLEDGLTGEEIKEVESIIFEHLDEKEYNQLVTILDKY